MGKRKIGEIEKKIMKVEGTEIGNVMIILVLTVLVLSVCSSICAQKNQLESGNPGSNLPDPLITQDGKVVDSAEMWEQVRRPEILKMFETELYGKAPGPPEKMASRIISTHTSKNIIYKQVELEWTQGENKMTTDVLICLPAEAAKPVPVVIGMNFNGNHTVTDDSGIKISDKIERVTNNAERHFNDSLENTRGAFAERWQVEMITDHGFGLVTLSRSNPQQLFKKESSPDDWGAISAWTWAVRRVIDYLETDDQVDHNSIMVTGTSRLGKVALWAGATDDRVDIVFPSCSAGCGGASMMSKRFYGEPSDELVGGIGANKVCQNFLKYLNNKAVLPFDQHMLLALIAPRPIYVATAEEQKKPHNQGMYLALKHAEPVYKLLGTEGFGAEKMPGIHEPVTTVMGFHIRSGKHGIEEYDWKCFLEFADKHISVSK